MRRVLVVLAAVALLFTVWSPAAVVAAGQPHGVAISSEMTRSEPHNTGTFTATGDAASSGMMCTSGSVTDLDLVRRAPNQLSVRKVFSCEDGSGTFTVRLQVHQDFEAQTETFTWVVLGGTGAYKDLRGAGGGTTETADLASGPVTNIYTGFLVDPAAGPPQGVTISSEMTRAEPTNIGTFTATGDAATNGLICTSGSVTDLDLVRGGPGQLSVRKVFSCDDGSGTFTVKLQIHQDFEAQTETFRWVVLGGTSAYVQFRGAGSGTTETADLGSGPVTNLYMGFLIR
jgi:hypothetical protein